MKRNWFNLVCIILSMLLIGANLAAYCGYWYNDGNALALLAAVLLLITSVLRFRENRRGE
ncbi:MULTISPECIES: hypothetical protein [Enterocloster]|uniref:Uncharacterized protein n=1 Tax=Enterocloster lavalensis TaxID=460384 RepID=A0A1I0JKB7_9FIRM|nr:MULTISPECIES: hypothetical protein [Enterocloster]MCB6346436.1 hypothetical protein [Enterocloster lavalensis]MDR3757437.1 hypothetical protein [Enterocloster sp.]PST30446.1 hypothetical protein C7256_25400 [Enterocloster lavalensis]SEU10562.1 hypothetical protein SAMN05216313_13129 [Enterocloster lavalensis]